MEDAHTVVSCANWMRTREGRRASATAAVEEWQLDNTQTTADSFFVPFARKPLSGHYLSTLWGVS